MKAFSALLRDILATLGRPVWGFAALTLVCALTDGLTVAVMLPLLASLGFGSSGNDTISRITHTAFSAIGLEPTVPAIGVVLVGLIVVSAVFSLAQSHVGLRLQAEYVAKWQTRLTKAILNARWSHLRGMNAGELASAVAIDAPRVGSAFYQANLIVTSACFVGLQSILAFVIAPDVAAVLVGLSAVLFFATRMLSWRAARDGRALSRANKDVLALISETVRSLKFLKASDTGVLALGRIEEGIARIERSSFTANFDIQVVRAAFEYGGGLILALLLIFGPTMLGFEIGAILVLVALFVRLFPKVTALRQCLQSIATVLPSFDAVTRIEREAAEASEHPAAAGGPATDPVQGPAGVVLRGLRVTAPDGAYILRDIDLDIPPGQFVAIVGLSGAGKTTLIDSVLGLAEPEAGAVLVDGSPLSPARLPAWRRRVGYLGQEPVLFGGTVAENIGWGMPALAEAEMRSALTAAAGAELLLRPQGLQADVGEAGVALSGGERQRVALARAIARSPGLLILDEATSALDAEAEAAIVQTVRVLRGRATVIAVAHRLWSVRDADRIVVLEAGEIVESGTFAELSRGSGRFRQLLAHQDASASVVDEAEAAAERGAEAGGQVKAAALVDAAHD